MELAAVFNPTAATSGQFSADTLQVGSTMIVINKSYVDVVFTFASGDQRLVIANDRRAFVFSDASSVPSSLISWKQRNIDYPQTINQLENVVYVEVYSPVEKVAEQYPQGIQRETLPSLVPYNIGYTATGFFNATASGGGLRSITVWPSSYIGVAVAPNAPGGLGYDYFWSAQHFPFVTATSLPSQYPITGKAANNATPNNSALFKIIPGPFSLPGLQAVDDASFFNGGFWQLGTSPNWNGATSGYTIDMWVNIPNVQGNNFYTLFGDTDGGSDGIFATVNQDGSVGFRVNFAGGSIDTNVIGSPSGLITSGVWHFISFVYTGTTDNHFQLWVDGVIRINAVSSGAPTNTASSTKMQIGSGPLFGTNMMVGAIANFGIRLSQATTPFMLPSARYEHGLQSLNVNYQNAWIDAIDFEFFTTATAITIVCGPLLNNMFNPGGLLWQQNYSTSDPLHGVNQNANTLEWQLNNVPVNSAVYRNVTFNKPITHYNDIFPVFFPSNFPTGVTYSTLVHGYNILGVF